MVNLFRCMPSNSQDIISDTPYMFRFPLWRIQAFGGLHRERDWGYMDVCVSGSILPIWVAALMRADSSSQSKYQHGFSHVYHDITTLEKEFIRDFFSFRFGDWTASWVGKVSSRDLCHNEMRGACTIPNTTNPRTQLQSSGIGVDDFNCCSIWAVMLANTFRVADMAHTVRHWMNGAFHRKSCLLELAPVQLVSF